MYRSLSPHRRAVLEALFVTFLWSTSWVLIKIGFQDDIPVLTFAGLRYTLAFLCLLPLVLSRPQLRLAVRSLPRRTWLRLVVLGLLFYAFTQAAQFAGLAALPAATVNLLLTLSAILVAFLGIALLGEQPGRLQWLGTAIYIVGVLVYFVPVSIPPAQAVALIIVVGGVITNALSSVLGRSLNRDMTLSPLVITVISMGIGGLLLLGAGVAVSGLPSLSLQSWLIVFWLALVNTAFAFTLWNRTLRTLSAMESSIINNLMMIQIPLLAWLFLGEPISLKAGIGFTFAGVGILIVQLQRLPAGSLQRVWFLRRQSRRIVP